MTNDFTDDIYTLTANEIYFPTMMNLLSFFKLEGNWDGHQASMISGWCIEKARYFLLLAQTDNIPPPIVNPHNNGGVEFNWSEHEIQVSFFPPNGRTFYDIEVTNENGLLSKKILNVLITLEGKKLLGNYER